MLSILVVWMKSSWGFGTQTGLTEKCPVWDFFVGYFYHWKLISGLIRQLIGAFQHCPSIAWQCSRFGFCPGKKNVIQNCIIPLNAKFSLISYPIFFKFCMVISITFWHINMQSISWSVHACISGMQKRVCKLCKYVREAKFEFVVKTKTFLIIV